MHPVISAIERHAAAHPRLTALSNGKRALSYAALHRAIAETAAELRKRTARAVALCLDNSPEWLVADLATLAARLPCVPLPRFFTAQQQAHALRDAGADCIITDSAEECLARLRAGGLPAAAGAVLSIAGRRLDQIWIAPGPARPVPPGTVKITYTSGTTGHPKGVCLGNDALGAVAGSLAAACRLGPDDRHLAVLPLATLLENVAVHAVLLAGGHALLYPLHELGFEGASGAQPDRLLGVLRSGGATTAIVLPQLLKGLVEGLEAGDAAPGPLRFLAVGGAIVSPALLERAARAGLPAFEGYGLSECASVLTLNTPRANRRGSAGRPLPHVSLSIASDGEILAGGAALLGYCGSPATVSMPWPTGDLGYLDADGYLHITGRKKDCFITSYGRNVSPEWIEAALTASPAIAQAWASGEARPWAAAVLVPRPACGDAELEEAVDRANSTLPQYARVHRWMRAIEPFSFGNGELTANGRPRRDRLGARYGAAIDDLYQEEANELLR